MKRNLPTIKERKGFALIYVLVFMTISTMAIFTLSMAIILIIKTNRQSLASLQTYNLAYSGIEQAYNDYKANPVTSPTSGGCAPTISTDSYLRVTPNNGAVSIAVSQYANPTADLQYDYRICVPNSGTKYLEAIGYYKGYRTSLKAEITDSPKKIKIYQTTPL